MKLIGKRAFCGSSVVELHIPDSVEEICESCFYECRHLLRLTFGESPSLKRIGAEALRTGFLSPDIIFPSGTLDGVEGISRCV